MNETAKKLEEIVASSTTATEPLLPSLSDFSKELFRRAPEEYYLTRDADTLSELASFVYENAASSVRDNFCTSIRVTKSKSGFCIATKDRPFIVDTIGEILKSRSETIEIFLHPIFKTEKENISVSYIEISGEVSTDITKEIEASLEDLVVVTDSFNEVTEHITELAKSLVQSGKEELGRLAGWFRDGGLVLLGYQKWSPGGTTPDVTIGLTELDTKQEAKLASESHSNFILTTRLERSKIKRKERIKVASFREDNNTVHCLIGLFTSEATRQPVFEVPVIRKKLQEIIEEEGLIKHSHDYKEAVSIIDSFPKAELFVLNAAELRENLQLVLSLQRKKRTLLTVHTDSLQAVTYVLVIIPRERFSEEVAGEINECLETFFGTEPGSADGYYAISDKLRIRFHVLLPTGKGSSLESDKLDELANEVSKITFTWDDELEIQTKGLLSPVECRNLARKLPPRYKAMHSAEEAKTDIKNVLLLSKETPTTLELKPENEDQYKLTIYTKGERLTLSSIVPLLENLGLQVLFQAETRLDLKERVFISDFHITSEDPFEIRDDLTEGMMKVLKKEIENTPINRLFISAKLNWKQVTLLNTAVQYALQIRAYSSYRVIVNALVNNSEVTQALVDYFEAKFDPERNLKNETIKTFWSELCERLNKVPRLIDDKVLRTLANIFQATVRTNYFFPDQDGRISLKIDCRGIMVMPDPRPLYEIFVASAEFAGVHLRGSKVARGGLRWSERPEDFRTEILGLMKTQVIKNSVIVPSGAKGGFVIKSSDTGRDSVEKCYRLFIRSLLELTDNHNPPVTPEHVVPRDEPDNYLVVAADKGTATFSDIANEVAVKEFDFWLGDAFASGGSKGYDHKKLGITARGAWVAACRHLRELGIDIEKDSISAVGIGDMSGDVFGNGMLSSPNIGLVAAFNHIHIFLDPSPNLKAAFKERERMFKLPRSTWKDYSEELISTGGGVFERSEKSIELSSQAAKSLGVKAGKYSGEELVKIILKAPVDLLWNGGIGTYIKSSTESHLDVGDRANDSVRINAEEVRAKIFAEGGNLGATQEGRIQYAALGGRINTDAVDNSGGVHLSDTEVNFKILLGNAKNRDKILEEHAEESCENVLLRNYYQTQAITLDIQRSAQSLGQFQGFLEKVLADYPVIFKGEKLPGKEEIRKRNAEKRPLFRPEVATLISVAKLDTKKQLISSPVIDSAQFKNYLHRYFPDSLGVNPENHPLKKEITATEFANSMVDLMGSSFVHRVTNDFGCTVGELCGAYVCAYHSVSTANYMTKFLELDTAKNSKSYIRLNLAVASAVESATRWFLRNVSGFETNLEEIFAIYIPLAPELLTRVDDVLPKSELKLLEKLSKRLQTGGVVSSLAEDVTNLAFSNSVLDIVKLSNDSEIPSDDVAKLYFKALQLLNVSKLTSLADAIQPESRWEEIALTSIKDEISRSLSKLIKRILDEGIDSVEAYMEENQRKIDNYKYTLEEILLENPSLSALSVLINHLRRLTSVNL